MAIGEDSKPRLLLSHLSPGSLMYVSSWEIHISEVQYIQATVLAPAHPRVRVTKRESGVVSSISPRDDRGSLASSLWFKRAAYSRCHAQNREGGMAFCTGYQMSLPSPPRHTRGVVNLTLVSWLKELPAASSSLLPIPMTESAFFTFV